MLIKRWKSINIILIFYLAANDGKSFQTISCVFIVQFPYKKMSDFLLEQFSQQSTVSKSLAENLTTIVKTEEHQQIRSLEPEHEDSTQRIARLEIQKEAHEEQMARLKAQFGELKQQLAELVEQNKGQGQQLTRLENENEKKGQQITKLEKQNQEQEQKITELVEQKKEQGQQITRLETQNEVQKQQNTRLETKVEQLIRRVEGSLTYLHMLVEYIELRFSFLLINMLNVLYTTSIVNKLVHKTIYYGTHTAYAGQYSFKCS